MAKFVRGDVVIVPFPFSDLTKNKRRPALVVASLAGDDVILCQITSQTIRDNYALSITGDDFASGGLNQVSNIRPNRIFTADQNIILYSVGQLQPERVEQVIIKIIEILRT
jgi:mRNA interferase MazF